MQKNKILKQANKTKFKLTQLCLRRISMSISFEEEAEHER